MYHHPGNRTCPLMRKQPPKDTCNHDTTDWPTGKAAWCDAGAVSDYRYSRSVSEPTQELIKATERQAAGQQLAQGASEWQVAPHRMPRQPGLDIRASVVRESLLRCYRRALMPPGGYRSETKDRKHAPHGHRRRGDLLEFLPVRCQNLVRTR